VVLAAAAAQKAVDYIKALRGAQVTVTRPTWGRVEIEYTIL
jgi:hypothetical protein